ncbi:MAG: transketolase, partial [Lachnospiraceae bacterium]|nr:transketolase [Lachnospiraceae bacterium]
TSGFSVGILGATHMCIEDLAIMRCTPNITVLSPADGLETYKALMAAAKHDGPVYVRMSGTMGLPIVYSEDYEYEIGKAVTIIPEGDVAVFATGTMVYQAMKAIEILKEQGISCSLYDMHTIKPIDIECIKKAAVSSKLIVSVEEHSVIGGLGSAIAECLAEEGIRPPQLMLGVNDEYTHAAQYDYLIEKYGLTPEKIAENIYKKIKEI